MDRNWLPTLVLPMQLITLDAALAHLPMATGGASIRADIGLQRVHGTHQGCIRGVDGNWHYHPKSTEKKPCSARPNGMFWHWRCKDDNRCGWWNSRNRYWLDQQPRWWHRFRWF